MTWTDIRRHYPHQWLLVEALLAHSKAGKRLLDELAIVDAFSDGETALRAYLRLHRDAPMRELYVVHSDQSWRSPSVPCWVSAPPDEDPAGAGTSLCGGGPDFPRAKPLSPRHHPRSDSNPGRARGPGGYGKLSAPS